MRSGRPRGVHGRGVGGLISGASGVTVFGRESIRRVRHNVAVRATTTRSDRLHVPVKRRALLALAAVLVVVGGLPAALAAQTTEAADDGDGAVVRIVARLRGDGRTEFGLQERAGVEADGSPLWGERRLPPTRYFPTGARVGVWLASSTLEVAAADERVPNAEVRITARRLADRRVEFGLQRRTAAGDWGERLLPQRRFFPARARVGLWLSSSALHLDSAEPTATGAEPEPPSTTASTAPRTTNPPNGDGGHLDLTGIVQEILGREDISDDSGFHPDALLVAGEVAMSILISALRLSEGLNALSYDLGLAQVARGWSETMAAESSGEALFGETTHFRHNPTYTEEYPPGWWAAGENIALVALGSQDDPWEALQEAVTDAFEGLVDSPGHYANMTSPHFNAIGVGIATSGREVYVTQNFAAYG